MSKLLVKIDRNWADEFDAKSFMVVEEADWKKCLKIAKRYCQIQNKNNESISRYFGSNQEIKYENFKQYKDSLSEIKISDEKAKEIMKMFKIKLSTFENEFQNTYGLDVFLNDLYHMYEVLDGTGLYSDQELISSVNPNFYE